MEETYTVQDLRNDLQTAMEVEHATIPPYLTALATLMTGNNSDIQNRLRDVFIQEMFHLALAANILNAVGGKPSLNYSGFIPDYPSVLPGGLHPKLIVPIKKFTRPLVKDVFSMIEQPEVEVATLSSFKHIFRFVRRIKDRLGHCQRNEGGVYCELQGNIMTSMNPSGCFISKAEKAQFLEGESDMIILFNHQLLSSYQKLVAWWNSRHFVTSPLVFQPMKSTTQIWAVTRHQYGISALVSWRSFREEISGDVV